MSLDEEIGAASERFYAAVDGVLRGDASRMLAVWSRSAAATYFDPAGGVQRGWEAVRTYWERAAEANLRSDATVSAKAEVLAIHAGTELAFVVVVEHVETRRAGHVERMDARATNVYRREGAEWKLIHRHADPPRGAGA
jgi:ketosteroid isomerase-like protein